MDNTNDLAVLLASQSPLLLVEAQEEQRLLEVIRQAATRLDVPVWTWSATRGLAKDGHQAQYQTVDPHVALEFVGELSGPGVFVFADVHPLLNDALVIRRIKEIRQRGELHPLCTALLVNGRPVEIGDTDITETDALHPSHESLS